MGQFPAFIGTMSCSDFRAFVPPRFVSFTRRYLVFSDLLSLTRLGGALSGMGWISATPSAVVVYEETCGSPRFLGSPLCTCRGLGPRWTRTQGSDAAFHRGKGVGIHDWYFEAEFRGPHTRCLRFAVVVAHADARLTSGCSTGLLYRTGWLAPKWAPI